jgi:hypothetical protein
MAMLVIELFERMAGGQYVLSRMSAYLHSIHLRSTKFTTEFLRDGLDRYWYASRTSAGYEVVGARLRPAPDPPAIFTKAPRISTDLGILPDRQVKAS